MLGRPIDVQIGVNANGLRFSTVMAFIPFGSKDAVIPDDAPEPGEWVNARWPHLVTRQYPDPWRRSKLKLFRGRYYWQVQHTPIRSIMIKSTLQPAQWVPLNSIHNPGNS